MQREQLNEASVGIAFAGRSRESITITRTSTIELKPCNLKPLSGTKNIPNIHYLRAIQPWG